MLGHFLGPVGVSVWDESVGEVKLSAYSGFAWRQSLSPVEIDPLE
jgi:hypothetical protein